MDLMLYRTGRGTVVEGERGIVLMEDLGWDSIFTQDNPLDFLLVRTKDKKPSAQSCIADMGVFPPVGKQEVWAAGVTYRRSREARKEEAKTGGGGDCYDRVYDAERPELFFKSTPHRVVGDGQQVRVRRDSRWNVPEPEATLAVTSRGAIFGYTIGNDVSSRDIEGENPLYLPQAKVFDQSCAIGPRIYLCEEPLPPSTEIRLEIRRSGESIFAGVTRLSEITRPFEALVEYLFRDNSFPHGCFLMTGTGIVPPDEFTLRQGDVVIITMEPVGTLTNTVM